ncbi:MAG: AzlD domain-containing protein [Oscillospiraceae bacterium]|nr:AzlD domain-containing protein [Oscillospiraceae bacterium]
MSGNIFIYIAVMAIVTYLVRMLPAVLIRRKIKSKLVNSFLFYMPYAALSAMTIPAVFYATGSWISAAAGFAAAAALSLKGRSLTIAAAGACISAFLVNLIISTFFVMA